MYERIEDSLGTIWHRFVSFRGGGSEMNGLKIALQMPFLAYECTCICEEWIATCARLLVLSSSLYSYYIKAISLAFNVFYFVKLEVWVISTLGIMYVSTFNVESHHTFMEKVWLLWNFRLILCILFWAEYSDFWRMNWWKIL